MPFLYRGDLNKFLGAWHRNFFFLISEEGEDDDDDDNVDCHVGKWLV